MKMLYPEFLLIPFLYREKNHIKGQRNQSNSIVNLFIINPPKPPKRIIAIEIGASDHGSCLIIKTLEGRKHIKETNIPLIIGFNFRLDVAIKKPAIVQRVKAPRFASHGSFFNIIGITSRMPKQKPMPIPIHDLFISSSPYSLYLYNK